MSKEPSRSVLVAPTPTRATEAPDVHIQYFHPTKHATRADLHIGKTKRGVDCVKLHLPKAKTSSVPYAQQLQAYDTDDLGVVHAVREHLRVNAPAEEEPVFGFRTSAGLQTLTYEHVRKRLIVLCREAGARRCFGHSFRIGGATYWLGRGVPVEWVRMVGRWRSLAFQTYIRDFEEIADQYLGIPARARGARVGRDGR
jgi:hypothetical protein